MLIQGNYLHDNGVSGSAYERNTTYTSSLRITYKENRFGPLCPTCTGNNLKDRSAGLVVQNNLIEGGNRQLDLVDEASFKDVPEYQSTHVFGNILVEFNGQGNRQMVHFGGDGGDMMNAYRKNLYFYHNTIVSKRTDKNTLMLLRWEGSKAYVYNNIIIATDLSASIDLLAEHSLGQMIAKNNMISDGYTQSYFDSSPNIVESGTMLASDYAPLFADADFASSYDVRLQSSLLGLGTSLEAGSHAISSEYVLHQSGRSRSSLDLGAYGFGETTPNPPDETCSRLFSFRCKCK